MRQGRLIATGAMLVFCVFAVWQSLLLSLTDRLGPGPGFFPFWLGLIGTGIAIALLVTTFREAADPADADADTHVLPRGAGATRWLAIVGALAIVTLVMDYVGFRLSMLVFNVALVVALGERRWWIIATFAVLGSYGVFYVFTTWLDVLLPVGQFGF